MIPPARALPVVAAATLAFLLLVSCRGTARNASGSRPAPANDDAVADRAMAEGRWSEAVRLHRALLDGGEGSGLTLYHLGFSEGSLGRHSEEAVLYERAIAAGYEEPDVFYNLGLANLALDRFAPADRALAEALRLRPAEPEFHHAAGRVALARSDDARAREHLERATELDPRHSASWAALAELYERSGDPAAAEAARRRSR